MNATTARFGFRVVDGKSGERRLVEAAAAFAGHCAADPRAEPERESYLSAFRFGEEFRSYLEVHRTTKGYAETCWSPWLWFDIDRPELAVALADTRRLVGFVLIRFSEFSDDDPLYFFSGAKGFHVGLPLTHQPEPAVNFHRVCRKLAEGIAGQVGVPIDTAIYDRVRLFRSPNSRHATSGLYKRRLTHDELMGLSADRIRELAREPLGFEVPAFGTEAPPLLASDWRDAEVAADEVLSTCTGAGCRGAALRLSRATLEFIRDGAVEGERHTRLFRAAANLREFAALPDLVHALLTEAALDSGLPPAEVKRQIDCGIAHADQQGVKGGGA
ncbi:MAG: DNA primase [Gemmataceae bacterium]